MMNPIDLGLLLAVFVFAGIGAWRGAVREGLALAVWVATIVCGYVFGPRAAPWLSSVSEPALQRLGGMLIVAFAVFAAGLLLTWVVITFVYTAKPGPAARVAGALLGLARGTVLALLAVLVAGVTPLPQRAEWRASVALGYLLPAAERLRDELPSAVGQRIRY